MTRITILSGTELGAQSAPEWRGPGVRRISGNGPVDRYPAERARHGWRALAFQAEQDSEAQKGPSHNFAGSEEWHMNAPNTELRMQIVPHLHKISSMLKRGY